MHLVDLGLIFPVNLVLGSYMLLVSTVLWVGRRRMGKLGKGLLSFEKICLNSSSKRAGMQE